MKKGVTKDITKEDAKCMISNNVYKASFLYEQLEGVGRIKGNGHHIMQQLCKHAEYLIEKYWIDQGSE